MCGIVGYVGHQEAWPIILTGLQHLEYRGYDSAGIALLTPSGQMEVHKSAGKVRDLAISNGNAAPKGHLGIGHTRWATHGRPTDANTHPHTDCNQQVVVVHNGIVENYLQLKKGLLTRAHTFSSETDSEVIAHMVEEGLEAGLSFEEAFIKMSSQLQGSQAVVAARRGESPGQLLALRMGHAGGIVVAQRSGEAMVSSDLPAMVSFADRVSFLEDSEIAVITQEDVRFIDLSGKPVEKVARQVSHDAAWVGKEGYKHYMLKEIMEQPQAASSAMRERVNFETGQVTLEGLPLTTEQVKGLNRVVLVACGTSLHAAMVGKYLMEELADITAEADSASEFRYRNFHVDDRTLVVSIAQSGETADTLAAMAAVRDKGGRLVTICNVEGSQSARLAEGTLYMRAGAEIGVASTKTFISSLTILTLLALQLGQVRGTIDTARSEEIVGELARLPRLMGDTLANHQEYERLARKFHRHKDFLYLGRGLTFPIAMEGALKLKEISYIHAEGYSAGEMKHGPIALIDTNMPVVAIAPDGSMHSKMTNNIREAKARDGVVIAVVTEGNVELPEQVDEVLYIPRCSEYLTPILSVLPLQLLAYYIAVRRGCDVDQPRNLAKSVTVE